MNDHQKPDVVTQYGVRYPDGTEKWLPTTRPGMGWLPGSTTTDALETAAQRGGFLDQWRNSVTALGIDPATVPTPTFITREITTSYAPPTDVKEPS